MMASDHAAGINISSRWAIASSFFTKDITSSLGTVGHPLLASFNQNETQHSGEDLHVQENASVLLWLYRAQLGYDMSRKKNVDALTAERHTLYLIGLMKVS